MRIELRSVGKSFGHVQALRGVSLALPSGARTALIGPNGSGKSTLIRGLVGLVRCTGHVLLDGMEPGAAGPELRRRIAYVPQIAPQFGAPVSDLVHAITTLRGVPATQVAEVARRLELDLEEISGRSFRNLSGGMKQKLLITLALASRPDLYILDEPTASLDARARERFFELFEEMASGATLLLCSHRFEEMRRLVDHVVLLEEGRVAWHGEAEEFLRARAENVVEVRLAAEAPREWLEARGFRHGVDGWWVRRGTRDANLEALAQVQAEHAARVREVLVRNLETIEIARGGSDA